MKLSDQVRLRKALEEQYPDAEVSLHYNVLWNGGKLEQEYYASIKSGVLSITIPIGNDESLDSIIVKFENGVPQLNMEHEETREEHIGRI